MRTLVVVVCVLLIPVSVSGQENDDLREVVPPQQRVREIAAAMSQVNDAKAAFVVALRRFVERLPGRDGDDERLIRAAVSDMSVVLSRWDVAIRSYRVALNDGGDSAEAHVALGTMYLDRGLTSDAADQFRRATTLSPKWAEASLLLGFAFDAQGKYDDAGRALATAARAKPDSAAISYARVQHIVSGGNEEEISRALLEFRDRQDRAPRLSGASVQAAPFVKLGLLRESPGVAPVFAPALYAEGFRLLNSRRFDEAVAAFRRADNRHDASDERESGEAYYRLGRLYQSQSRIPEALAAFTASAERVVVVGRDALFEAIAALRVGEGDFAEAIAAYRLELEANPNNGAAHRRLGDLYAQDGRLGESLAEYAASLLIDPRDANAHASRAQALLRLSRFADAEAAARVAVALEPDHAAAQYALGTALMRTGREDEGLTALKEFERLQVATRARKDAAWQIKLLTDQARDRVARQEYAAAADLLRRAAGYAPEDASIRLAAGAFLIKAEKYDEAIPLLKEALERGATDAQRYLAEAYEALGVAARQ